MILIKKWRVTNWLPDDATWLAEQGFNFHPVSSSQPVTVNGITYQYKIGDMGITVETTTPEQELLLKLKFDPNLALMIEEWALPLGECTLSDINWDRV